MSAGRTILWALLALIAAPACADAPDRTPRARPEAERFLAAARPHPRPAARRAAQAPPGPAFLSPDVSIRPWPRPQARARKAMAKRQMHRKGTVCGDLDIRGEAVGHVPGRIKACGIKNAVRVRAVSGVRLNPPALMNCKTAVALREWTDKGLKPAFRQRGPVVEMKVAAHYACRTRNNRKGARISEHGKGNAIDLSAFTMMDGEVITVLAGWGRGTTLRPLQKAYRRACGPFGTTLGPTADRYHRDHFHFDTARYRSGPYCR